MLLQRRVGSDWRCCGEALAARGNGEDKGEVRKLLDTVWSGVELAVDDQKGVAPFGHHHADIGIPGAMPVAA